MSEQPTPHDTQEHRVVRPMDDSDQPNLDATQHHPAIRTSESNESRFSRRFGGTQREMNFDDPSDEFIDSLGSDHGQISTSYPNTEVYGEYGRVEQPSTHPLTMARTVGEYNHVRIWGSSYGQVGQLFDFWSELLPGYAKQYARFAQGYLEAFARKDVLYMRESWGQLTATGFNPPSRGMVFYRRHGTTVTVYIATQGKDLYISWRAYIQGVVSIVKILLLFLMVFFSGFIFYYGMSFFSYLQYGFDLVIDYVSRAWVFYLPVFGIVMLLIWVAGFFRQKGDIWAYLRNPPHLLQLDDVSSLAEAVHQSLIESADQLGVDTATLKPRDGMSTQGWRARF